MKWRFDSNESPKRADQRRRRQKQGIGGVQPVVAAGQKMPQLMAQQNGHQRQAEAEPAQQRARVMPNPGEREEVVGGEVSRKVVREVELQAGADDCSGE